MARLTFALCAAGCMAIVLVSGETTVSTVLLKPEAASASLVRLEPGAAYPAFGTRGNAHAPTNLPILVLGGGGGTLKGGRHLRFPSETPPANLHVTLLDKLGVPVDRVGDRTGPADLEALSGV